MYTLVIHLKGLNLLILPPATTRPKGIENNKVSKKISMEVIIPPNNCAITVLSIIDYSPTYLISESLIS